MEWIDYCKLQIPTLCRYYKNKIGCELNINNPQTFTEKVQWLKIYDSSFIKSYCTDKITLHSYCKRKLGRDICIPILATYSNANEICFNNLPNGFVAKCNHGSGYNIICKPNTIINQEQIKHKLNTWLAEDFSDKNGCELHYKVIPPRILIEPYMNDGHSDLTDYKVYCFNGQIKFFQVISNRTSHELLSHYTLDWKPAPQYNQIGYDYSTNEPKPELFQEMCDAAMKLSQGFKLVRVDFYIIQHKLYLGEMTFTPNSGVHRFTNPSTDRILGQELSI